jgi:hypothetical protein
MVKPNPGAYFYAAALLVIISFPVSIWAQNDSENSLPENTSATENNTVFLQTSVNKTQAYVQEALIYSIKLYYTLAFERGASFSSLEMSDAAFNKLGEDLNYTEAVNDILYTVNESRFVIFPQSSGEFTIAPVRFRAFTQTRPTRNNPNLQTTAQRQSIELFSQEHQILILPVPDSFPSPVWLPSSNITISESWSRPLEDMRIGDSVVRTIQFDAEDLYASMLINLDFTTDSKLRYYPAEAQQVDITESSGVRSGHTQNITLVATEAGRFTLPAVEIPWWNTASNSLEYASLPSQELDILTVDGERLEPEPSIIASADNTSNFWSSINLNLLLFIGVILLISTLFFAPATILLWQKSQIFIRRLMLKKDKEKHTSDSDFLNINNSFKLLKQACAQQDIKTTAHYFLLWGQAYFKDSSLYNFDKIIDKFDTEFNEMREEELNQKSLSPLITQLQTCLYAEDIAKSFDFNALLQVVDKLHNNRKLKQRNKIQYNLPPLYKN